MVWKYFHNPYANPNDNPIVLSGESLESLLEKYVTLSLSLNKTPSQSHYNPHNSTLIILIVPPLQP